MIFSWFYSGVNHYEPFEETEHFYVRYDLGDVVTIDKVCNDLSLALKGRFKVIEPENQSKCIDKVYRNNKNVINIVVLKSLAFYLIDTRDFLFN